MDRPLTQAGEYVDRWLAKKGKRRTWLAKELGVDRVVLWRWLVGETTPHIDHAAALEALTGLPARSWATNEQLRERRMPGAASDVGQAKRLAPTAEQPNRRDKKPPAIPTPSRRAAR
ncbi:helix-turn-helix transcriptional regulator [Sorangium sp. So ce375]|uniref:helix-turn-helix domain-containing protein n=1 Tax=Sorangium sp. So ce375 TaxID=3133306 RepID=UPI003F5BBD3E